MVYIGPIVQWYFSSLGVTIKTLELARSIFSFHVEKLFLLGKPKASLVIKRSKHENWNALWQFYDFQIICFRLLPTPSSGSDESLLWKLYNFERMKFKSGNGQSQAAFQNTNLCNVFPTNLYTACIHTLYLVKFSNDNPRYHTWWFQK